jgi:FixJ family two-component response regulator
MTSEPTIFVVDDDPAMRESLKCLFDASGDRCQMYASAEEFLKVYDPNWPGCLILDLRMPGMNGLELQEYLSELNVALPVIMFSAHGDIPAAVSALQQGAMDFVQKPFDPNLLLERVRAAIAHDAEQRTKSFDAVATREGCIEMDRRGRTYENIARRLGTSYNTVKNQRASILRKLDADSVVDVVRMVAEHEKG